MIKLGYIMQRGSYDKCKQIKKTTSQMCLLTAHLVVKRVSFLNIEELISAPGNTLPLRPTLTLACKCRRYL